MAATAAVKCPTCGLVFDLPMHPVAFDPQQRVSIVSLESAALLVHAKGCTGGARPSQSTEVAIPDQPPYVAPGSRYCVGCGATSPDCLRELANHQQACCGMCAEGDTHPAPEARSDA